MYHSKTNPDGAILAVRVQRPSWTPYWITAFCPTFGISTQVFLISYGPYKDQESKFGDIKLHTGPPQPQDYNIEPVVVCWCCTVYVMDWLLYSFNLSYPRSAPESSWPSTDNSVQHKHIQSNLLRKCNSTTEHSVSWRLSVDVCRRASILNWIPSIWCEYPRSCF